MTKLVIALDNLSIDEAKDRVMKIQESNKDSQIIFKVNDLLALVGYNGLFSIFQNSKAFLMLDTKYNDIGNTLKNYLKKLADSQIKDKTCILTVHASVGKEALTSLANYKKELGLKELKIFAITALTSLDEEANMTIFGKPSKENVLNLAQVAYESGIDGIVCSANEVAMIKEIFGRNILTLTPGIRFDKQDKQDQKRVATIDEAVKNGSDYIVMGRPILNAPDMQEAINKALELINSNHYEPTNKYSFEKLLLTGTWEDILKQIGVIYERKENGKFCRIASGLLTNVYINIAVLERYPLILKKISLELRKKLIEKNIFNPEFSHDYVVMGAQMGSVRISSHLGEALGLSGTSIYTEKSGDDNKEMALKRHLIDLKGKKIILSEDIVTKGTTLRRMTKFIKELEGVVVGITCVGNRTGKYEFEGIPLLSCIIPPEFEYYYDEKTPQEARENYPQLPENAQICEKPKASWTELTRNLLS
ncbi:MAG: orotidine-5'-phosphate decarboxylase [Candidatus Gracilibacteria bacterium]|nr:orotidine-5'-phosphate decarboxylase [Candidatus Gracilibacteria bacterium]